MEEESYFQQTVPRQSGIALQAQKRAKHSPPRPKPQARRGNQLKMDDGPRRSLKSYRTCERTHMHTHTENHPELGEAFLHFTPKSQPIKGKIYKLIKMKTFLSVKDPAERMKRQAEPAGNNCKPPGRVSGTHDERTKPNDSARNPARAAGPRGKRTADAHADGAPESRAARGCD